MASTPNDTEPRNKGRLMEAAQEAGQLNHILTLTLNTHRRMLTHNFSELQHSLCRIKKELNESSSIWHKAMLALSTHGLRVRACGRPISKCSYNIPAVRQQEQMSKLRGRKLIRWVRTDFGGRRSVI